MCAKCDAILYHEHRLLDRVAEEKTPLPLCVSCHGFPVAVSGTECFHCHRAKKRGLRTCPECVNQPWDPAFEAIQKSVKPLTEALLINVSGGGS